MIVRDRVELLACFDGTANAVFETLCHLTAGDVDLALDLTVDTYAYLSRLVEQAGGGIDADRRWMVAAAHSVYAAGAHRPGPVEPVALLAPLERVVSSLQHTEQWDIADVAALADVTEEEVRDAAASATRALGSMRSDVAFRACEVWLDDHMRADARVAVAAGAARPSAANVSAARASPSPAPPPRWSLSSANVAMDRAEHAGSSTPARTRSRGVRVAALVAAAAAIGALVLWVRPPDAPPLAETIPTAAPSTSNRPPVNTTPSATPAPASTDAESADTKTPQFTSTEPLTGYITDAPPPGFQAGGGYADGRDAVSRRNWFQLWSTDGATRTSGRWLGLIVVDEGGTIAGPGPASAAQRVEVDGRPALARSAPDGVISLILQLPGRQQVEMRAFGYTTDELATLVGAVTFADDNHPSFGPSAVPLLEGLALRSSERTNQDSPSLQAFNHVQTTAFYVSADGRQSIAINSGAQTPDDLLASRLLNPPPAGPVGAIAPDGKLPPDAAPGGTAGVTGTISELDGNDTTNPYSFVQWHLGGSTITVIGDVPAEQLLDVARAVRPATVDEWVSQSRAVPVISSADVASDPGYDPTTIPISATATDAGPTWTVSVDHSVPGAGGFSLWLTERRAPDQGSTSSATYEESKSWFAIEPDEEHPVHEYNSIDATIVVVVLTDPPEGAKVRLTLSSANAAATGRILPLVPIDDNGVRVAAYAFSEQSTYTVDLMEVDGSTVVRTLPH